MSRDDQILQKSNNKLQPKITATKVKQEFSDNDDKNPPP